NFQYFGVAGDTLYFAGHTYHGPYTDTGTELWKIDNAGATNKFTLTKDEVMNPIVLDYSGEGTPTWEVYPDLHAGLSINSENGIITGTPPELSDLTSYTVYANASVTSTPPDSILYYNVGDDDDDDGYWEDIHGNTGYDIAISNLERVETTGNTDLTHAYRFDSSSDSAVMGNNFQDWSGDLTDDSISIEMWFKPSALSGNKVLWEIGGTSNGNSLVIMDDELTYRLKASGDNAYADISTTISLDSEFHHAVVVLNKESQTAYLYYDGELKNSTTFSGNFDWGGNNDAGIGCVNDNVGGYTNSEQTEYFDGDTTFRGDIAIHRILEAALDSSEVGALYDQFTSYRYQEIYNLLIEVVESDTDGDGYSDSIDDFPTDPAAHKDTDGDGMPDTLTGDSTSEPPLVEDLDDDNDGYNDTVEIAEGSDPLDVESTPLDTDGDFDPDSTDPDDDNDGYNDTVEIAEGSDPLDVESIPVDTDGDFDPDSTDPDDDGDGYDDGNDTFPLDKNEWLDNDEDGTGDNADPDDDNDGLDDIVEDANGNGTVDEGETDPLDPDTDDDGYCDGPVNVTINEVLICEVEDRDGDGIADDFDAFPDDINEWEDTDGDEIGNNADPDDDDDGYNDTVEVAEGSDPLNFTSTPLDTDGDFDPDSTDPDDDGDGFDDGDDVFPTNSAEWLDTDDDGTGNNADTDDDGDGLSDEDEATLGSDPLIIDTDADGIPDNWDPLPTDPNGDFDEDGKLDSEEYNPASDGTPADTDTDGTNDMRQAESTAVKSGSTSVSQNRSWAENCCLILLLLLLLLIPLLIRKYNNSLIYEPNPVTRILDDNMPELHMVPSLHEYTKKYIKRTNSDGLRRVRYAVSGDLLEGLEIDSKTGIISGYPEKAGIYNYEVVMKHSKGKFKGEIQIEVVEKSKAEEADEILERGRKLLEEIEADESKVKEEEEYEVREAELKAKEEELETKEEELDSKQAELDRIAAKAETIDFGIIGTASASDKDDLKLLKGIGPFIEEKLNALGIYKVEQIAKMTPELEDEVNIAIEFFPGRVKRDEWVNQAKELSK
ncbi:MAG: LamG-like jellyroll fold domain-containing protein, partial [Candidatus Thermoplasmatota archaeon]|nr:LamG-like jellyroll fold domain-containing protein [Candidatus Thermoplasmatota archaeon]